MAACVDAASALTRALSASNTFSSTINPLTVVIVCLQDKLLVSDEAGIPDSRATAPYAARDFPAPRAFKVRSTLPNAWHIVSTLLRTTLRVASSPLGPLTDMPPIFVRPCALLGRPRLPIVMWVFALLVLRFRGEVASFVIFLQGIEGRGYESRF